MKDGLLREVRLKKRLKLKDIAEACNVTSMYISELERRKKSPSDEMVEKMAKVYGLSDHTVFYFFGRIPEKITDVILGDERIFKCMCDIRNNPLDDEQKELLVDSIISAYDKIKNGLTQ